MGALPADAVLGVAPHSLRAVPASAFAEIGHYGGPRHIHVSEQTGEVEEVRAATGTTPIAALADIVDIAGWTLIHCTHATPAELEMMVRTRARAGLCPITESNLGDGIFDAAGFLAAGGAFCVGSDSNVRIAMSEELRTMDYSQRLALRRRNPLATAARSSGRVLYEGAAQGGAAALGRPAGEIAPGALADLVALGGENVHLAGLTGDTVLDALIFAGDDRAVRDVWSAGRHVVRSGRHVARETIAPRFEACLARLRAAA